MAFPAPFIGQLQKVEDQWIDYNGHFNMAYYNVLFDRAGDEAFALVGLGPDYVESTNCSFFTLEAHVTYVGELHAGDTVRIATQFLDHDAKRVHYVQQMFHAKNNRLACFTENIVMHIDLAAKKSAPFPTDVLRKINLMCTAHKLCRCRRRWDTKLAFRVRADLRIVIFVFYYWHSWLPYLR